MKIQSLSSGRTTEARQFRVLFLADACEVVSHTRDFMHK